jgi:hypothetical protein
VGLGFIFAPQAFGSGAVPADASPALIAYLRLFGAPLLGIAVLDWSARNAEPSTTRNAILLGNIVGFAAIGALDVWGLFSGARPVLKAFVVIICFSPLPSSGQGEGAGQPGPVRARGFAEARSAGDAPPTSPVSGR